MTNKNKYLEDLSKKLSAEKFRDELNKAANMVKSKEVQKHFNDEMVRKTWDWGGFCKFYLHLFSKCELKNGVIGIWTLDADCST